MWLWNAAPQLSLKLVYYGMHVATAKEKPEQDRLVKYYAPCGNRKIEKAINIKFKVKVLIFELGVIWKVIISEYAGQIWSL